MTEEQQLQQKIAALKGDIYLLEKQRDDITRNIANLQISFKAANKEFALQKKQHTEELTAIKLEAKRLQRLATLFSLSYEEMQQSYEKEKIEQENALQAAKDAVKTVYHEAKQIKGRAEDLLENTRNYDKIVTKREQTASRQEENNKKKALELEKEAEDSELRKHTAEEMERKSHETVAKAQELLDDIERQVTQKRMELQTLTTAISKKAVIVREMGVEAELTLKEAKRKGAALSAKEVMLDEKAKKLAQKEAWLNGRAERIRRAYDKVLSKGGLLNG